jgi:hypothetical protein
VPSPKLYVQQYYQKMMLLKKKTVAIVNWCIDQNEMRERLLSLETDGKIYKKHITILELQGIKYFKTKLLELLS